MASNKERAYAELVYEVLQTAPDPLTFQEIFDQVNKKRPIDTRNPKGTIRNALNQGKQLVSTGDGRYGYLPHLIKGSLLRLPLTQPNPQAQPLTYTDEIRHAFWPSIFESEKRSIRKPAPVMLPNGKTVALSYDSFGPGFWGDTMPKELQLYLVENAAETGDALLVRIKDAEVGPHEATFEAKDNRDVEAVAGRNQELADAAYQFMRKSPMPDVAIWDLIVSLLGRGFYHADVAPDPVIEVLNADSRFVYSRLSSWGLSDTMTEEMQSLIDYRLQLESSYFPVGEKPSAGSESPQSRDHNRPLEQTLADIGAIISEGNFASIDEANSALQLMNVTGGVPHRRLLTPLQRAQEIIYNAWEIASKRERIRLAKKALEISPDCADAYNLLAEDTAQGPEEEADLYAQGVAAGERALGKNGFKEHAGHFWGVIETRPYMRARCGLAINLWTLGRREEAIAQVWDMLRLNPGDNQGMRYSLFNWLLELGDQAQIRKFLKKNGEEITALWLYGRALFAFQSEGDTQDARRWRSKAVKANPRVPVYLSGRKRLPKRLPDTMGLGSEDEAVICADGQIAAWRQTPGALEWLGRNNV